MRSFRARPVGWRYMSHEHRLARMGIRTKSYRPGVQGSVYGAKILVERHPEGEVYPVTPDEVKRRVAQLPEEDVRGLKSIEFVKPNEGEQRDAWAQLIRSKKKLLIFSQKVSKDGKKISGDDPRRVREHMLTYVIPHEVGHHVALNKRDITDKHLYTAEARADAYAAGMDVEDRDGVKAFEGFHKGRG